MNKLDIYDDFYFNGKKLSDFGGIICDQYGNQKNLIPKSEISTTTIAGYDGEIPFSKRYGAREWTENVYFDDFVDIRIIAEWLSPKEENSFYYIGDDVFINAIVPNEVNFEVYCSGQDKENRYLYQGLISIPFIAYDPFYKLIEDISYEFSTVGVKTFKNKGNYESLPLIRFEVVGTQNLKFKFNDVLYELKSIKDWCEINTRTRTVKDATGNKRTSFESNGKRVLDFPKLKSGDNKFELTLGSIRKVIIKCNSRFI